MTRKLLVLIVALLALTPAGNAAAEGNAPPATNIYTGTLTIVHSDPQDPTAPPIEQFYLIDAAGDWRPLSIAGDNDSLYALIGQEVIVAGSAAQGADSAEAIVPTSIHPAAGITPDAAVTGNTKWLTLACKFPDVADEPRNLNYFQGMYGSTYPGLDHYWREASYNNINLLGSTAKGWFTLPKPKSDYKIDYYHLKWRELFLDCAALADAEVNFGEYYGVSLMLNSSAHCCATSVTIGNVTLDNVTRTWPVNFIPPWGYTDITVTEHEMAHGYGLHWHAYSGANAYGDPWDVLGDDRYNCAPEHPVYGCLAQHTQMYNRDYLGWVPAERKVIVGPGVTTLTLVRATQPPPAGSLMAIVPIDGSTTHYYVIEARQRIGYDTKLYGNSIVIHEIGGWYTRTQLMDAFAMAGQQQHVWAVGDTWYAPAGNISVHVDAATATGFTITVDTRWLPRTTTLLATGDTTLDQGAPDANFGHDPQLRIEGNAGSTNEDNKIVFLKFDPTQLPPRITRLRLLVRNIGPIEGQGLFVQPAFKDGYGYGADWNEYGLAWINYNDEEWWFPYGTPTIHQPNYGADGYEFDIAGIVAVAGGNAVRALAVSDIYDYVEKTFSSREGANPPQLIIEYLVPPDEPTTHTFTPTNDATVSQAKPKLISGGKPTLQVQDAAKDLNAYIKFNVTGLDGAVQSATLRLWVTNGGPDGGRVYTTSPFYPGTTTQWLETGLKWNNAPAISGAALDTAGAVAAGQWIELDVTAAITGNGRASFALTNDATDLVVYSSKEGAHAPELVVVTD